MTDKPMGVPAYVPSGPQPARLGETEMKNCPHCKKELPPEPKCCYHCKRELTTKEYESYRISCQRCKDDER